MQKTKISKAHNLSDIWLVPRCVSEIQSRRDISTNIPFCNTTLDIPLIASPMPDVVSPMMINALANNGSFGFLHRFCSTNELLVDCHCTRLYRREYGVSVGVNDSLSESDRFNKLYDCGIRAYCIDTANGANKKVAQCIERMLKKDPYIDIIAGNICTKEGYRFLAEYPLRGIRCGNSGGFSCKTRHETAIFYPMASSILEVVQEKNKGESTYSPPIIADGGINTPHNFCVALFLGADLCMAGKIFAATKQSPARVLNLDGKLMKVYRGSASFSNQIDYTGKKPEYVEGFEKLIEYTGELSDVIKRFSGGLRSAMSYMNAKNLSEFKIKNEDDICYKYDA